MFAAEWRVSHRGELVASGSIGREWNSYNQAREQAYDCAYATFMRKRIEGTLAPKPFSIGGTSTGHMTGRGQSIFALSKWLSQQIDKVLYDHLAGFTAAYLRSGEDRTLEHFRWEDDGGKVHN